MSDPNEKCRNCSAPRSAHKPAKNGGLDCPPRADGKIPVVVGEDIIDMDYENHCAITTPRIEWRDPGSDAAPALAAASDGGLRKAIEAEIAAMEQFAKAAEGFAARAAGSPAHWAGADARATAMREAASMVKKVLAAHPEARPSAGHHCTGRDDCPDCDHDGEAPPESDPAPSTEAPTETHEEHMRRCLICRPKGGDDAAKGKIP